MSAARAADLPAGTYVVHHGTLARRCTEPEQAESRTGLPWVTPHGLAFSHQEIDGYLRAGAEVQCFDNHDEEGPAVSLDQDHADALEEITELKSEVARLHVLLTEHNVEDPSRARLSKRQKRILAEADLRDARVLPGARSRPFRRPAPRWWTRWVGWWCAWRRSASSR